MEDLIRTQPQKEYPTHLFLDESICNKKETVKDILKIRDDELADIIALDMNKDKNDDDVINMVNNIRKSNIQIYKDLEYLQFTSEDLKSNI